MASINASPQLRRRRGTAQLANAQIVLWSAGNALTSGPILTYLALDLGATGFLLSLVLAIPALLGSWRVVLPLIIQKLGGTRRACVSTFLSGYLVFAILTAMLFAYRADARTILINMIVLLCLHQMLEHVANAALFTWLTELVPHRCRGKFFARRQALQLMCLIPVSWLSGYFIDSWRGSENDRLIQAYAIVNLLGIVFLFASVIPLLRMRDGVAVKHLASVTVASLIAPWRNANFRRVQVYNVWLAFFNGITQSAQSVFQKNLLKLPLEWVNGLRILMNAGQFALSTLLGRWIRRFGNQRVIVVSQLIVATAPVFFVFAAANSKWMIGAYAVWSAYAGINICLPNLVGEMAPPEERSAYIGTHFAVGGVAYAVSTVLGGLLYDFARNAWNPWERPLLIGFSGFSLLFLLTFVARMLGVVWIARVHVIEKPS